MNHIRARSKDLSGGGERERERGDRGGVGYSAI